jgi:hypothetical protein
MKLIRTQIAILLLALCVPLWAQTQSATTLEANLRRHIEYLASDELEGRRTGEPGAALAAGYIANQFAKVGLKPGSTIGNGKAGYMQQFPYVTGVEMTNGLGDNRFSLQVTDETGQRNINVKAENKPVGFSPNGRVLNAEVVYAGFGIVTPDRSFDDYKYKDGDLDVHGKVVIIFDGNPDNDNPHSPFGKFDLRTKALIAKEHGAVGILSFRASSTLPTSG